MPLDLVDENMHRSDKQKIWPAWEPLVKVQNILGHSFVPTSRFQLFFGSTFLIVKNLLKAKIINISPLEMSVVTSNNLRKSIAINEVSILRQSRQAANLSIKSNSKNIIKKLVSDGVLVSTPAGSTAYNLSVHGPILSLNSKKISIAPISAFRPRRWAGKIVSDKSKVIKMKYPHIQDEQLQNKVYLKKEFQHFYESSAEKDIEQEDEKGLLCASTEFELAPHQMFVKTFLSNNTPYNGLLLYHGMGSGKTCSAIGICEEFRKSNKFNHEFKKIIILSMIVIFPLGRRPE